MGEFDIIKIGKGETVDFYGPGVFGTKGVQQVTSNCHRKELERALPYFSSLKNPDHI